MKVQTTDKRSEVGLSMYSSLFMGDILVKEGHLFSIVFISKFLGCWNGLVASLQWPDLVAEMGL
jgi:hypothetical protein